MTAAAAADVTARDQFRRLAVLIATCFVDMIGFAIVLPILPFYALDLKGSLDKLAKAKPTPTPSAPAPASTPKPGLGGLLDGLTKGLL